MAKRRRLRFGTVVNWTLLLFLFVVTLYPFWYVVCMSLSTYTAVIKKGLLFVPVEFSLASIRFVVKAPGFGRIYLNTAFVVIVGTLLSMFSTMCLAYPLTRRLPGRRVLAGIIFFTMLFSGGMIPTYLVVRATGLLNRLWALILPVMVSPFNVFLLRSYFQTIPESLNESAEIDGAGVLTILFRIIMPVSLPGLATVALFYAVGYWGSFFDVLLYISQKSKWTLQMLLREILINVQPDSLGGTSSGIEDIAALVGPTVKMAVIVVSIVPIMVVYPFLQKYFVKGVMVGAIKG
jgi:putative aldouronate transport system permease protein